MQVLDLDAWHTQLPHLIQLRYLSDNTFNQAPKFSANFTLNPRLDHFHYQNRNTSVLPWKIIGAPGLKYLGISVPRLSNLRSDFLTGLNLTYLSFVSTGSLPPFMYELPDFSHLTNLEYLDLSNTAIRELPDKFTNLVNLRVFLLDSCTNLTKISASLSNCVKLEILSCNRCKLNRADSLPNLSSTRLEQLNLDANGISTVWPAGLCQLSNNPSGEGLRSNPLSDPPPCFEKTTNLRNFPNLQ